MKKAILNLGIMLTASIPVVAVISCGDKKNSIHIHDEQSKVDPESIDGHLTNNQSTEKAKPLTMSSLSDEVQDFFKDKGITKFDNNIKANQFAHTILPKGFSIPDQFISIERGAFKNAEVGSDFSISPHLTKIDPAAFEDIIFPSDYKTND